MNLYITVASWEDRFKLGFQSSYSIQKINDKKIDVVWAMFATEFAEETLSNRVCLDNFCANNDIIYQDFEFSLYDCLSAWKGITTECVNYFDSANDITIDISTMPRYIQWTLLDQLHRVKFPAPVNIIYYKPEEYGGDWISRNPLKPFLLPRCGGITDFSKTTALFIISGYDTERISHLISSFEPTHILIAIREGKEFSNDIRNRYACESLLSQISNIDFVEIDGYDINKDEIFLSSKLEKLCNDYNVVVTSLGPKTSALTIFRLHAAYPQSCLIYTPSLEYNKTYSTGLGASFSYLYNASEQIFSCNI